MLSKNMTLKEIIEFEPKDKMLDLDLDVRLYLKVSLISYSLENNYNFIRYLFSKNDLKDHFKNPLETSFLDYDGSKTKQERIVTVFELFALKSFEETSDYLKEALENFDAEVDIVIDIFTYDDKKYRLSNLDGIIVVEALNS